MPNLVIASSTALSLASAAVVQTNVILEGCILRRIMFQVKTATSSSGTIVVSWKKYPIASSSSGAVVLGSLNIPTGVAAGQIYFKELDSINLEPGNALVVEVVTAATSAGDGYAGSSLYHAPEAPVNVAVMVAST